MRPFRSDGETGQNAKKDGQRWEMVGYGVKW